MSLSELKIVINEIIDDYNLDIILLVGIIIFVSGFTNVSPYFSIFDVSSILNLKGV